MITAKKLTLANFETELQKAGYTLWKESKEAQYHKDFHDYSLMPTIREYNGKVSWSMTVHGNPTEFGGWFHCQNIIEAETIAYFLYAALGAQPKHLEGVRRRRASDDPIDV